MGVLSTESALFELSNYFWRENSKLNAVRFVHNVLKNEILLQNLIYYSATDFDNTMANK